MNEPLGTGTYHNEEQCRYEYWVVNQATGEKKLLVWITDEVPEETRREYDREVWLAFLIGRLGEAS
jgi:hypothetical protein